MLSSIRIVLLVALIIQTVLSSQAFFFYETDAKNILDAFQIINEYLIKNVKSDNIEDNMAQVEKLYWAEDAKFNRRTQVYRAAEDLKILGQILEPNNRCRKFSYWALGTLNGHTQGAVEREKAGTRVEKIARHYALKHAEECRGTYEPRLETAMQSFDLVSMKRIDAYLALNITHQEPPNCWYLMDGITADQRLEFHEDRGTAMKAYKTLLKLVSEDKNEEDLKLLQPPTSLKELNQMFKDYFVEPCESLFYTIGDVALPAIFDNEAVIHGELPEIYSKFVQCAARQTYPFGELVEDIAKIIEISEIEVQSIPSINVIVNN